MAIMKQKFKVVTTSGERRRENPRELYSFNFICNALFFKKYEVIHENAKLY